MEKAKDDSEKIDDKIDDNQKEPHTKKPTNENEENEGGDLFSDATGLQEPPDSFNLTKEEQEITVMYENLQNKQDQQLSLDQQQPLEKKKPPRTILEKILEKNAKGLEQSPDLLGPGTIVYVKWSSQFRKSNKAQWDHWDTPWGLIKLTEETQKSNEEKAAWNWVHPTRVEIHGHIKLVKNQAWEITKKLVTKEQEKARVDRNKDLAHDHNKLAAPTMTNVLLQARQEQPEPVQDQQEEFQDIFKERPELLKEGPLAAEGILAGQLTVDISANSNNFQPKPAQPKPPGPPSATPSQISRTRGASGSISGSITGRSTTSTHMTGLLDRVEASV